MRFIDGHALMEELQKATEKETSPTIRAGMIEAQRITHNAPTVSADRPQGEWICKDSDDKWINRRANIYHECYRLTCPKCNHTFIMPKAWGVWKGCPTCWKELKPPKDGDAE